jgi:2-C-methyl-D-erythritol 2,4-cyclodiphosphate synthase
MYRIGFGNDIHRLSAGRPLVIGGVSIPSELGAEGHSDADVLLHAVTDAIFGALALGDIGTHFPNSDPQWKGADSRVFLEKAVEMAAGKGYRVGNLDSTIGIESPKLGPFIYQMQENLAAMLGVSREQISVKAKTGEGVDAVGEERAVRAEAVVLLERP